MCLMSFSILQEIVIQFEMPKDFQVRHPKLIRLYLLLDIIFSSWMLNSFIVFKSRWTFNSITINKPHWFWQLFVFNWCIPQGFCFVSFWVFKIFMNKIYLLLIETITYENINLYYMKTENWITRRRFYFYFETYWNMSIEQQSQCGMSRWTSLWVFQW